MIENFIFVTRMFSGLFESIENREWNPTGIPTITKLVERISQRHKVLWIVSCKNNTESAIIEHKLKDIVFPNFTIRVIPYKSHFKSGKLNLLINNIVTLYQCIRICTTGKKRIFYCDRSNIITAAFIKLVFNNPVVVRILGVYPDQKQMALKLFPKVYSLLTYICYQIKFDLVVCTQDGSGGEYYLKKLLNKKTLKKVLLNGVERKNGKHFDEKKKTNKHTYLLFVGKLIEEKGIVELIEAVKILKKEKVKYKLSIIGKGELENVLKKTVNEQSLNNEIEFLGSVPNEEIYSFYLNTDVYISLNKLGNLSNTVLEAMSCGKCVVMLGKDFKKHTDIFTEAFIPRDTAIRIDRKNIVKNLTDCLKELCENEERIIKYSKNMEAFAASNLWSWRERIDYEINIIKRIAKEK